MYTQKENSTVLSDDLIYEILSVVEEIPEGRVAIYGQISRLMANPKTLITQSSLHGIDLPTSNTYKLTIHRGQAIL